MRNFLKVGLLMTLVAAATAGIGYFVMTQNTETAKAATVLPAVAVGSTSATRLNTDPELGEYILSDMEIVHSPLSPLERQATAQFLVGIANNAFETLEQKENWVIVLGDESHFNNSAVSPTGAVGVGQLIPSFAVDFAATCGIKNFQRGDEKNLLVNATLSACFFRDLLEVVPKHSVTLALSAYNSGLYSKNVKDLQALHNINLENANYIARFTYVKEELQSKTTRHRRK